MTVPSKSKNAPTRGPGGEASTSAISCSSVHTARRAIAAAFSRSPPPAAVPRSAAPAGPAPPRPTRPAGPSPRRSPAAPRPPSSPGRPSRLHPHALPPRRGVQLVDHSYSADDVPDSSGPVLPAAGQLLAAGVDEVEVGGQPQGAGEQLAGQRLG